jgi:diguanylate cyclase (GGDEF)-like protein/PAS domain S-box-containing protein
MKETESMNEHPEWPLKRWFLEQILDSTKDCVKVVSPDGQLLWMNQKGHDLLGIDASACIGKSWIDFWHKDYRQRCLSAIDEARNGVQGRFEGAFITPTGEENYWDVSVTELRGRGEEAKCFLVISRETTDHKKLEHQLRQTSTELNLIVDRLPALVGYIDSSQNYRWVNKKYADWYRLSPADLVGKNWRKVLSRHVSREYAEELRPHVESVLKGKPASFEATQVYAGRRRSLSASYVPDVDNAGKVLGFVLLIMDVTEQVRAREEMLKSQERFRTLSETLPSIVWAAGPGGEIDYLSERYFEATGRDAIQGLGADWYKVIHPDDLPQVIERWAACVRSSTKFSCQYRIQQQDGSYRWCLARALPQRNEKKRVTGWTGVSTDIHQQVQAEQWARASESRYRLLFEDNPLPMWTYHRDTLHFLSVNDTAVVAYGYSRDEFLQMKITQIRPDEDVPQLLERLKGPLEDNVADQVRHKRKNGTVFWAEVNGHALSDSNGAVRLVVAQDVTERVKLNQELIRRAEHDPLTGLPNRILLEDRFEQARNHAVREQRNIGVVALDFDRFKAINDTFGHQLGDKFLKSATERLRGRLRDSDTLSRIGGDEFVVLLQDLDSSTECERMIVQIMDALATPVEVMDVHLKASISVGFAMYPEDGKELDDLIRRADYGLYQAKRAGRNAWRRYERTNPAGVEQARKIEGLLRRAIQENRLELHYQPVVDCSGRIRSLEALVRLQDQEHGIVPPSVFIPIAEESGLIHTLGI